MTPIILETTITPEMVEVEDSGMAVIVDPEWTATGCDDSFFVRLHSWDEEASNGKDLSVINSHFEHKTINSLVGKKVRVTVEIIES